ncbi:hypothetical protein LMG29542_07561 [Paraburkholderia humisilvae]|uniref:Uncharacterized protein n=1 Tax=Paraburkholderia humisilvae TaxID=627669 RepID=A0A6J5F8P1_9BURK|nr:hypothetical protein LMG29542_07561 [Paraburkholderia humisilvae]
MRQPLLSTRCQVLIVQRRAVYRCSCCTRVFVLYAQADHLELQVRQLVTRREELKAVTDALTPAPEELGLRGESKDAGSPVVFRRIRPGFVVRRLAPRHLRARWK